MRSLVGLLDEPKSLPYSPSYTIAKDTLYRDFAEYERVGRGNLGILED